MIGFHGTDNEFEAFSEAFLGSNDRNSPNGRLGVWFYTDPELAALHGKRVLAVEADIRKPYCMTVRELMHVSAPKTTGDIRETLGQARTNLIEQGYDAVRVVEMDGESLIGIILDLNRILAVTEYSPAPTP